MKQDEYIALTNSILKKHGDILAKQHNVIVDHHSALEICNNVMGRLQLELRIVMVAVLLLTFGLILALWR